MSVRGLGSRSVLLADTTLLLCHIFSLCLSADSLAIFSTHSYFFSTSKTTITHFSPLSSSLRITPTSASILPCNLVSSLNDLSFIQLLFLIHLSELGRQRECCILEMIYKGPKSAPPPSCPCSLPKDMIWMQAGPPHV